ncbi:Uncharacterised protein [Vibrio cholerae]|nr:Uncharacterised protein [Vibrio cholerae]
MLESSALVNGRSDTAQAGHCLQYPVRPIATFPKKDHRVSLDAQGERFFAILAPSRHPHRARARELFACPVD